jgi:nucleoid DNA-binding protein
VTKKEIVKKIAERAGLTQLKTKQIVQWTFDEIIETLLSEKRIELRNFGVFEVKRRKARKARNPRTDEQVFVGPKNVVTFQPGKEMEEQVRELPLLEEKPRKTRKARAAAEAVAAAPPHESDGESTSAMTPPAGPTANSNSNGHDGGDPTKKKKVKKEA